MGEEKLPQKVKLFFGLIFAERDIFDAVLKRLANDYGDIDYMSDVVPFDKTSYYEKEIGANLSRVFISIKELTAPDELPSVKIQTNILERHFGRADGTRIVNIDPGYLGLSKVVLATTKDYNHRLYLGRKIFGEVTLHYKGDEKTFAPWEWTYPDYREKMAIDFFNHMRQVLKEQLKRKS